MTAGRGRRRQMDFQNRVGGKTGSGGLLNESEINQARRDRLRKLALETIDLTKDPYFMKNHLGTYECRLCLTLHNNEGSYLSHTQGKKHQANLSRRAAKEAALNPTNLQPNLPKMETQRPSMMKIGRPGYKAMKVRDPLTKYPGVLFQIHYPNLGSTAEPRYRIMSAFEQRIEQPNKNYQYLVVAAEPYESIGFKIPNKELDNSEARIFSYWDVDSGIFTVQVMFRSDD